MASERLIDWGNLFVFDGTNDFLVWRARMEGELLRRRLLGYALVPGYDGSQSFQYKGQVVPAKHEGGLGGWAVLREAEDAMGVVQRFLHANIESVVLNKSIYDSWATLKAIYGSGRDPATRSISEMYRVLQHIFYGDKKGESIREFITRWEMVVQQYTQATGAHLTDPARSAMLEQALPRSWRPEMSRWRGSRPFVPFAELVTKAIGKADCVEPARSSLLAKPCEDLPCFYCFRANHSFKRCRYLAVDIETGNTHNPRSAYSCCVTENRTPVMVRALDAYVDEVMKRTAHRPSMPRGSIKREREADRNRDDGRLSNRSQSRPRTVLQRPRSVHATTMKRLPSRARSQSTFRGDERSRSTCINMHCNDRGISNARNEQRCLPFERALRSPP